MKNFNREQITDLSNEQVNVVIGNSTITKSKNMNDRIISFNFIKANKEYAIDVPVPENVAPALVSGQGINYTEEQKAKWLPHRVYVTSSVAGKQQITVCY